MYLIEWEKAFVGCLQRDVDTSLTGRLDSWPNNVNGLCASQAEVDLYRQVAFCEMDIAVASRHRTGPLDWPTEH